MRLYYADIAEYSQHSAGLKLLSAAYGRFVGGPVPEVLKGKNGKPFFPNRPDVYFSISHSGNFALCAIDFFPVGADIEFIRPVSSALIRRVCGELEAQAADFFTLWVLKESLVKLRGRLTAPYKELCFESLSGGDYSCKNVKGRVFDVPAGFKTGVCTEFGELPRFAEKVNLS